MKIGMIITIFIGVVVAIAVMPIIFASFNDLNMQTVAACELTGGTEERFQSVNANEDWSGATTQLSKSTTGNTCSIGGTAITGSTTRYTPNGEAVTLSAITANATVGNATWMEPLEVVEKQSTLNRLIISVLPVILVAGGLAIVGMWASRYTGRA